MNLKQLEAFVHVAEGGSFSKAAKELFLTQPTVSAHIAGLEKELNARLFVRNTKEVKLSEEGKLLYDSAKQIVVLQKKIEKTFWENEKKEEHCITIAASTIPAQYLLPEILVKFNEKYPNEQFKVIETDSARVVEEVLNHSVDIGFTGTVLDRKHCKYIPFYQDELVVIAPNTEKFKKLQQEATDIRWILQESVIMREEGSGTRKEAEKQLRKIGIDIGKLNIVASMENQEAIKKSVENGMGVSMENEKKEEHCITIAASTIPAQYLLPEILVKFNEKYPNEQFKVIETDSARVVEEVLNHSVDIGFTGTVLDRKHCKYIPFYQDELVVIAPNTEKFKKLQQEATDIRWILQESVIMREEGSGTRKEAEKQLRKIGIDIGKLNIVASMENQEAIKKSVENGMGVSIISKLAAEEEMKKGRIIGFSLMEEDGKRDINVVYNRSFQLSHLSERFVKTVKEIYK